MSNFVFSKPQRAIRITNPQILESLRRFNQTQRSTARADYSLWKDRGCSAALIEKRFGSWQKALDEAGITFKARGPRNRKEMVAIFKQCWEHVIEAAGGQSKYPSVAELNRFLEQNGSRYRATAYRVEFGGIRKLADLIVDVQK